HRRTVDGDLPGEGAAAIVVGARLQRDQLQRPRRELLRRPPPGRRAAGPGRLARAAAAERDGLRGRPAGAAGAVAGRAGVRGVGRAGAGVTRGRARMAGSGNGKPVQDEPDRAPINLTQTQDITDPVWRTRALLRDELRPLFGYTRA